jgi:hypothetical protein
MGVKLNFLSFSICSRNALEVGKQALSAKVLPIVLNSRSKLASVAPKTKNILIKRVVVGAILQGAVVSVFAANQAVNTGAGTTMQPNYQALQQQAAQQQAAQQRQQQLAQQQLAQQRQQEQLRQQQLAQQQQIAQQRQQEQLRQQQLAQQRAPIQLQAAPQVAPKVSANSEAKIWDQISQAKASGDKTKINSLIATLPPSSQGSARDYALGALTEVDMTQIVGIGGAVKGGVTYVAKKGLTELAEYEAKQLALKQAEKEVAKQAVLDTVKTAPKPSPNFIKPVNPPSLPPTTTAPGTSVRVGQATEQYPNGYWKLENKYGQPLDPFTGKLPTNSASRAEFQSKVHVPLPPN